MVTLIVPMLLTNIVAEAVNLISGVADHIVYNLLAVNGFVVMITACYVIFYIAYQFESLNEHMKSIITCLGILVLSILAFLFEKHIPFTVWPVPCLGFIYGMLIADNRTQIIGILNKQKIVDAKTILLILASIVIGGVCESKAYILLGRLCVESMPGNCIDCITDQNYGVYSI